MIVVFFGEMRIDVLKKGLCWVGKVFVLFRNPRMSVDNMKQIKMPIRHKGSGEKIGEITMMSDIDDILFAIEDEIDKKEIHKGESVI